MNYPNQARLEYHRHKDQNTTFHAKATGTAGEGISEQQVPYSSNLPPVPEYCRSHPFDYRRNGGIIDRDGIAIKEVGGARNAKFL